MSVMHTKVNLVLWKDLQNAFHEVWKIECICLVKKERKGNIWILFSPIKPALYECVQNTHVVGHIFIFLLDLLALEDKSTYFTIFPLI